VSPGGLLRKRDVVAVEDPRLVEDLQGDCPIVIDPGDERGLDGRRVLPVLVAEVRVVDDPTDARLLVHVLLQSFDPTNRAVERSPSTRRVDPIRLLSAGFADRGFHGGATRSVWSCG
jgi:hypothetical protein